VSTLLLDVVSAVSCAGSARLQLFTSASTSVEQRCFRFAPSLSSNALVPAARVGSDAQSSSSVRHRRWGCAGPAAVPAS